jgi:hypothetical protein
MEATAAKTSKDSGVTEDAIVVAPRSKAINPDISGQDDSALEGSTAENAEEEENEDAKVEIDQTDIAGDDDDDAKGAKESDEVGDRQESVEGAYDEL